MGFEKLLTGAFEQAGVLGLVVAGFVVVVVLGIVLVMKLTGVSLISGKQSVVAETKVDNVAIGIAEIQQTLGTQLDKVEDRMAVIEADLGRRATRDEVHKLELAFTRMEGRFESIDQRTAATSHAVGRIESFMYEAAMRSRGDK